MNYQSIESVTHLPSWTRALSGPLRFVAHGDDSAEALVKILDFASKSNMTPDAACKFKGQLIVGLLNTRRP